MKILKIEWRANDYTVKEQEKRVRVVASNPIGQLFERGILTGRKTLVTRRRCARSLRRLFWTEVVEVTDGTDRMNRLVNHMDDDDPALAHTETRRSHAT